MPGSVDLIASYWTLAGNVYPTCPDVVSRFSFEDRVEAAAAAGYKGIGLMHDDLAAVSARLGLQEMRRILDANGLREIELELLSGWFSEGSTRAKSDTVRRDLLSAAGVIGARCIKLAPSYEKSRRDTTAADTPNMIDCFSVLCAAAAAEGTAVALEIMPFSNVRTLPAALALVTGAGQPNGGLYIDIWHMARGGIGYDEVARVPRQYIISVELDDADADVLGSLEEDTIHHRRLCGEGALDPKAFIDSIASTGYAGPYAVEILSRAQRSLSLRQAAERSFQTAAAQFPA